LRGFSLRFGFLPAPLGPYGPMLGYLNDDDARVVASVTLLNKKPHT
jgi:hypothetical protein